MSSVDENEELYRILCENSIDALIIGDTNGKFIYASPSTKQLFGYEPEEIKGCNAFEFFHPEDINVNQERLKQLVDGKEYPSVELRFRKKNGEYVWIEDAIRMVKTKQGQTRLVIAARDITERKRMQEELRKYSENLEQTVAQRTLQLNKTNDYLQQLVSRLPISLIAWDEEYKITTWNPEATKTFGFSESEFMGNDATKLFPSEQGQNSVETIWKKLQTGESADLECENITKDGTLIVCSWINTPLRNEKGNLTGVLSMVQNITEKRKLQERLKEITYSLSGVKVGESYLTSSLQHSLKTAFDLGSCGAKGLYIIRENPDSIVKNYNFKPEDIVLISSTPIKEFKAVQELQEIAIIISKFLKRGGEVVVLGGLEYLISRFGFNPVFMLIQEKRFEILEAGAIFLISMNMETLDIREKSLLSSELKISN